MGPPTRVARPGFDRRSSFRSGSGATSRPPCCASPTGRVEERGSGPMADPLDWIDLEAEEWASRGLSRRLTPHGPVSPGRQERDGRVLVNFGSNDYLGLAADPRVIAAAVR